MSRQYDATLNPLLDARPDDWAAFLAARAGVPPWPAAVLDTDLSSTLQADRLFRIDGPSPAVVHLELESSGRLGIPAELLRYNVAAWGATNLPVHSVLVLLRPKANATDLTGTFERLGADGRAYHWFRYSVVRVWQESVETLLAAGPGLTPLALLTNEADADLPAAFGRFREQLRSDAVPDNLERMLLGSMFVLCGLRYRPEQIVSLYRDLSMTLEDSTTYQLILNRGRAQEGQRIVLLLGATMFGPPPAPVEGAVKGIADSERLERMTLRVTQGASGWDDLLATQ